VTKWLTRTSEPPPSSRSVSSPRWRNRFDRLDADTQAEARAAIRNANNFFVAMARTTGDALMLIE
jgi:hypothetical protein